MIGLQNFTDEIAEIFDLIPKNLNNNNNPPSPTVGVFSNMAEFVLFLAVLENSVLPMGRYSSHETAEVTAIFFYKHYRNEKLRITFAVQWPPYSINSEN